MGVLLEGARCKEILDRRSAARGWVEKGGGVGVGW